MKKEFFELSPEQQQEIAALAALPDDQIDTTDIPEVSDWSQGKRGSLARRLKRKTGSRSCSPRSKTCFMLLQRRLARPGNGVADHARPHNHSARRYDGGSADADHPVCFGTGLRAGGTGRAGRYRLRFGQCYAYAALAEYAAVAIRIGDSGGYAYSHTLPAGLY